VQVTQAHGFDGDGEALEIVNQIAGVVEEILPGDPPFGSREIHVSLDDRKKAVPLVHWQKHDHEADRYRVVVTSKPDAWYLVIYEGFRRTMPLSPANSRAVQKESRLWQSVAYQLSHELAHVKLGPARSNLALEVMATAVSLETLGRLEQVWKDQPPRMSQGRYRAKQSFRDFHETLMAAAHENLPRGDEFGMQDATALKREALLKQSRQQIEKLPLWDERSRAWQMIAADCLLSDLRSAEPRWSELPGLAVHTFPSAWDDRNYRDDLPLVGDVVPLWWPDWLK